MSLSYSKLMNRENREAHKLKNPLVECLMSCQEIEERALKQNTKLVWDFLYSFTYYSQSRHYIIGGSDSPSSNLVSDIIRLSDTYSASHRYCPYYGCSIETKKFLAKNKRKVNKLKPGCSKCNQTGRMFGATQGEGNKILEAGFILATLKTDLTALKREQTEDLRKDALNKFIRRIEDGQKCLQLLLDNWQRAHKKMIN